MNKQHLQLFTFLLAAVFLFAYCQNPPEEASTEDTVTQEEDTTTMAEKSPVEQGEELYISYCGICHGNDGKGAGAMADLLKIPPSDLTTIQSRREGTFPDEVMHEIIRGGQDVAGHGEGDNAGMGRNVFRFGGAFQPRGSG